MVEQLISDLRTEVESLKNTVDTMYPGIAQASLLTQDVERIGDKLRSLEKFLHEELASVQSNIKMQQKLWENSISRIEKKIESLN